MFKKANHVKEQLIKQGASIYTCSIEGQAMIWRSSLLNSSFNKAWSFWNIC